MFRRLYHRVGRLAHSWIMHVDTLSGDRLENDEVGHVPVQDSGKLELAQMLQLEPERSAEKMQMARHLNEGAQRDAIERGRVATSQGVQIKLVAVVGGHHGQAGKATFGRFRLPNDGQLFPGREAENAHWIYIRTPRSGLVSQLISERFSRMMSALRSMSGWSATFSPFTSISACSRAAVIR